MFVSLDLMAVDEDLYNPAEIEPECGACHLSDLTRVLSTTSRNDEAPKLQCLERTPRN